MKTTTDNSLFPEVVEAAGSNQPGDPDTEVPLDPPADDDGDDSEESALSGQYNDNNPDDPIDGPDPDLI